MTIAALFLAVAAATPGGESAPPPPRGVELASAQVSAVILRPAIVRQSSGLERGSADAPRTQITRRGREVLIEFQ